MSKKVLNLIQGYHPARGGAELFMKILSEYQANELGYEVDVWTTDVTRPDQYWNMRGIEIEKKEEMINGVNVRRFPIGKGLLKKRFINKCFSILLTRVPNFHIANFAATPTTFEMLDIMNSDKLKNYDIVTVSTTPYYFLFYVGYLISKKLNIPYVIAPALHTGVKADRSISRKYLKKTALPFFMQARKIILNTEAEGEAIVDFCRRHGMNIGKDKFEVIGQGVFLKQISHGNEKNFRKKYGIKGPVVFQMGSKNKEKGNYNLIEAMKPLWEKGLECNLVFAGTHSDEFSGYIDNLDNRHKKWVLNIDGISDDDKWDIFAASDIFSMISKTDSFGIVYLEAWAYRNPVLACNNEAIKQVVNNGEDGCLLDFDDVEGISKKIEYLLKNESIRKKMGRMGRKKVWEKYDWGKNVKKIRDVYKNL